jgi:hypothetical protein
MIEENKIWANGSNVIHAQLKLNGWLVAHQVS